MADCYFHGSFPGVAECPDCAREISRGLELGSEISSSEWTMKDIHIREAALRQIGDNIHDD